MFIIAYNKNCYDKANQIAKMLNASRLICIEDALEDPTILEDFDKIGLIFNQKGKALDNSTINFIKDVLSNYDLRKLDYMFSLCVCEEKEYHSLKIVEKLCSKIGCTPSLSMTLTENSNLDEIVNKINNGDIILPKGSLGTMFFMKFNKIR